LRHKTDGELKNLSIGDLVQVDWSDASIGKSLSCGMNVDVSVSSWGVYLGLLGQKTKHIILVQNNFRYADGLCDLDYTAIPLVWSTRVAVIIKNHIQPHEAESLLHSFLMGGGRRGRLENRTKQQHVSNHRDRLD
jgi:hypothetical protein